MLASMNARDNTNKLKRTLGAWLGVVIVKLAVTTVRYDRWCATAILMSARTPVNKAPAFV